MRELSYIRDNIDSIKKRMAESAAKAGREPEEVLLIAVTKLHSPQEINEAIDSGITDIGENKVQEILDKYDKVKPVKWHLIGHLQTNKVKYIIDKVEMIHSVDSLRLATEIEKRAASANVVMKVLIQVNPAGEESKFGLSMEDAEQVITEIRETCPHVDIKGLMCIAPFFDDPQEARPIFAQVKKLYDKYAEFEMLSMGMTGDYQAAIEEGATAVRVGTAIFGNRDYRSEEK